MLRRRKTNKSFFHQLCMHRHRHRHIGSQLSRNSLYVRYALVVIINVTVYLAAKVYFMHTLFVYASISTNNSTYVAEWLSLRF